MVVLHKYSHTFSKFQVFRYFCLLCANICCNLKNNRYICCVKLNRIKYILYEYIPFQCENG